MINLTDWVDIDEEVRVDFVDGEYLIGKINSVDDEEESGLGEMGISMFTRDGRYIEIGESEIQSMQLL